MAEVVRMPKLSDTMTEGVVAEWHKKVGDTVNSGDVLAEIETDKATMEFESFEEGVLLHIGVEKGKAAAVDAVLAILGKKGEDVKSILAEEAKNEASASKEAPQKEEAPAAKAEPAKAAPATAAAVKAPVARPAATAMAAPPVPATNGEDKRIKASPLAKRLASEQGVNIALVKGSGDNGRVTRRDLENFNAAGIVPAYIGKEEYYEEEASQMRKAIAHSLGESKFSAPHFYLTMEIDMDRAIDARQSINAEIAPAKISFNDMIIKAVASSLRKHPKVNSSWLGDRIRYNNHIHIGVAVAVDEGLLVPVVRFADGKPLTQIGAEVKEFAKRARSKKLQPQDWTGNTFTISNLGMFGIEEFTAIINTPDACILAVGGIKQTPVVKAGQIVPGNRMKVTLSCDHRVVDGAVGSAFLQTFKNLMENPVMMLGSQSV